MRVSFFFPPFAQLVCLSGSNLKNSSRFLQVKRIRFIVVVATPGASISVHVFGGIIGNFLLSNMKSRYSGITQYSSVMSLDRIRTMFVETEIFSCLGTPERGV